MEEEQGCSNYRHAFRVTVMVSPGRQNRTRQKWILLRKLLDRWKAAELVEPSMKDRSAKVGSCPKFGQEEELVSTMKPSAYTWKIHLHHTHPVNAMWTVTSHFVQKWWHFVFFPVLYSIVEKTTRLQLSVVPKLKSAILQSIVSWGRIP